MGAAALVLRYMVLGNLTIFYRILIVTHLPNMKVSNQRPDKGLGCPLRSEGLNLDKISSSTQTYLVLHIYIFNIYIYIHIFTYTSYDHCWIWDRRPNLLV